MPPAALADLRIPWSDFRWPPLPFLLCSTRPDKAADLPRSGGFLSTVNDKAGEGQLTGPPTALAETHEAHGGLDSGAVLKHGEQANHCRLRKIDGIH